MPFSRVNFCTAQPFLPRARVRCCIPRNRNRMTAGTIADALQLTAHAVSGGNTSQKFRSNVLARLFTLSVRLSPSHRAIVPAVIDSDSADTAAHPRPRKNGCAVQNSRREKGIMCIVHPPECWLSALKLRRSSIFAIEPLTERATKPSPLIRWSVIWPLPSHPPLE